MCSVYKPLVINTFQCNVMVGIATLDIFDKLSILFKAIGVIESKIHISVLLNLLKPHMKHFLQFLNPLHTNELFLLI